MNKTEQIKYDKLKEENKKLKEQIQDLEKKISKFDTLVIDLYAVLISTPDQLSSIWSYFKEMYPTFINNYESRTHERLVQLWNYVRPSHTRHR